MAVPDKAPKPKHLNLGERLVDLFPRPPGYEGSGVVMNGKEVSSVAPKDTPEAALLLRAWRETSGFVNGQIEFVSRIATDLRLVIDFMIERGRPEALQFLQRPVEPLSGGAGAAIVQMVDLVCQLRPADQKLFKQCLQTLLGHKAYAVATAVTNEFARREAGDRARRDAEFEAARPSAEPAPTRQDEGNADAA